MSGNDAKASAAELACKPATLTVCFFSLARAFASAFTLG